MRVYVMTDMEGCAGLVNSGDWALPSGRFYDLGRELLTREVNAAVEGFFAAGATKVDVVDGHGPYGIDPILLDNRVRFVRVHGYPFMLDDGYDAIAWIGQHAKAGSVMGHLCHTGSFNVLDQRINGVSMGEFGSIALCAAAYGIRPIFGAGDHAFTLEAQAMVPGIETVSVKQGLTPSAGDGLDFERYRAHNLSAVHLHPEAARRLIREGAERALRRFAADPGSYTLPDLIPPFVREVDYRPSAGKPAYSIRMEHPDSVVGLMRMPEEERHIVRKA